MVTRGMAERGLGLFIFVYFYFLLSSTQVALYLKRNKGDACGGGYDVQESLAFARADKRQRRMFIGLFIFV